MTVDHKAIREALEHYDTNVSLYWKDKQPPKDRLYEWLRQLLDGNEHLERDYGYQVELAKAWKDRVEAQAKEIERLKIALHTHESYDRTAGELYDETQAQAKEIERLRMENKTIREKQLRQLGLPMRDLCERMACENEQLQADKATAVETLKWIADAGYGAQQNAARTALQRIESGDTA